MKKIKKLFYISIYTLLLSTSLSHATSWPIFIPPDLDTLLKLNVVDMQNCPAGQGKLASQVQINVSDQLCKSFCPGIWNWISDSDEQCHDLTQFNFQQTEIVNHDSNGTSDYSVITTSYGEKNSDKSIFRFIMKTQPGDSWTCSELNPEIHSIFCTNDI